MTIWVALLTVLIFAVAVVAYRGLGPVRQCPTCKVDYEVISETGGMNLTYDVLACPRCSNCATRVHGTHSHLAYCPACRNRSLETPSVRTSLQPPEIEIRENCHLCGFQRTFAARGEEPRKIGVVIPFPLDRRRKEDDSAEG